MIDLNKTYRTRDGKPVRLLGEYSSKFNKKQVIGIIQMEGEEVPCSWSSETGLFFGVGSAENDLIEHDELAEFSNLPIDTPVWVRDSEDGIWLPRYFHSLDRRNVYPFNVFFEGCSNHMGHSRDQTLDWKYCRLTKP